MIELVGTTVDGQKVVKNVYRLYETSGIPLDVLLETLKSRGYVPDWPTFVLEAVEAGMKVPRILSMLDAAIADSYGPAVRDVVLFRLRSLTEEDREPVPEPDLKLYLLPEEYHRVSQIASKDPRYPDGGAVDEAILTCLGQVVFDRMKGHVVGIVVVDELPDERLQPV